MISTFIYLLGNIIPNLDGGFNCEGLKSILVPDHIVWNDGISYRYFPGLCIPWLILIMTSYLLSIVTTKISPKSFSYSNPRESENPLTSLLYLCFQMTIHTITKKWNSAENNQELIKNSKHKNINLCKFIINFSSPMTFHHPNYHGNFY